MAGPTGSSKWDWVIDSFGSAFVASIVISIVSALVNALVGKD